MKELIDVDKSKLEEILNEIQQDPELKRAKHFVQNFFSTLGGQNLEQSYLNYLDDLVLYSQTNKAIRDNTTYLCYAFSQITNTPPEQLAELEYKHHGAPKIIPLDLEGEHPSIENIFGKPISVYTAQDAVRDGAFI